MAREEQRRFGLIVIGDEILSGRRSDKHLNKMIELLSERGLHLSWARYVADDPNQITQTLKKPLRAVMWSLVLAVSVQHPMTIHDRRLLVLWVLILICIRKLKR